MRWLCLVLVASTAHADVEFGELLDGQLDATSLDLIPAPPEELTWSRSREDVIARSEMFDRALPKTTAPGARANLVLARADLWAAYGLMTWLSDDELAASPGVRPALARALEDYARLVKDPALRTWPNMPHVLRHYAHVLRAVEQRAAAAGIHRRLAMEFPDSPDAIYAELDVAEYERASLRPLVAMQYYQQVADAKGAPPKLRAYALLRLGWILIDRSPTRRDAAVDGRQAFDIFKRALALSDSAMLTHELETALASAFAFFGSPDAAYATLAPLAPGRELELIDQLAELYVTAGKPADSIAANSELVRRAPRDPRICAWQSRSLRLVEQLHDPVTQLRLTEELVEMLPRMRRENFDDAVSDCASAITQFTLEKARARRTDNPIFADRLFELFLQALPDDPQAAMARHERERLRRSIR